MLSIGYGNVCIGFFFCVVEFDARNTRGTKSTTATVARVVVEGCSQPDRIIKCEYLLCMPFE